MTHHEDLLHYHSLSLLSELKNLPMRCPRRARQLEAGNRAREDSCPSSRFQNQIKSNEQTQNCDKPKVRESRTGGKPRVSDAAVRASAAPCRRTKAGSTTYPRAGPMQPDDLRRKWLNDQLQQGRHIVTTNRIKGPSLRYQDRL